MIDNSTTNPKKIEQSILITRPKESALSLAKSIEKEGYKVFIESMFEVQLIDGWPRNKVDPKKLQALMITSVNAIDALEQLELKKDLTILTVGKATAGRLQRLGYNQVYYAQDSARSLLELACQKLSFNGGEVFYLSGQIITLDLAEEMKKRGYQAKRLEVYRTIAKQQLSEELIAKIENHLITAVLIYSKNTATIFQQLIQKYDLLGYFDQIELRCLSGEIVNHCLDLGFKKVTLTK